MATLETFRRVVGNKVGLDYENAGDERDLIDEWCSQGVRDVLMRTHCFVDVTTLTTTADEWRYDLSYSVMAIKHIWVEGSDSMVRVSPSEIIDYHRADASTDGSVTRWALLGTNQLLLWPTPSTEYDISLIYVPAPSALTFDTHDPSDQAYGGVPTEYHKAIEMYALAEAADYDDDQSSAVGLAYRQRYEEEIMRIKAAVNRKGGPLPPVTLNRRRYRVRSREDIYP